MNYKKIYDQIIEKRRVDEPQDCYTEVHHIVPASLGGSNDKDNLVRLTAREHFICHYLLAKIYEKESFKWYKMNHAFMMMKCQSITNDRYFNSRLYDALKTNRSTIMSFAQSGKNNNQYGKVRCVPINAIDCKHHVGYFPDQIPEGWITTKEWRERKRIYKHKMKVDKMQEKANFWYNEFINGNYSSLNDFIKNSKYPHSIEAASKMFQTYIDGYNKTQGISKKFL